jgi:hypothetical protein
MTCAWRLSAQAFAPAVSLAKVDVEAILSRFESSELEISAPCPAIWIGRNRLREVKSIASYGNRQWLGMVADLWRELGEAASGLPVWMLLHLRQVAFAHAEGPGEVAAVAGRVWESRGRVRIGAGCPPCQTEHVRDPILDRCGG